MTQPLDLPFKVEEYHARLARVHAAMRQRGIDLLMIHSPENSYYLSGYRTIGYYSYMALLVPRDREPIHISRLIERNVILGTSWVSDLDLYPDTEHYLDATVRVLKQRGMDRGRIGVDESAWFLTIGDYKALTARLSSATFVDATGLIDTLRLVKSPAEQAYSRRAAQIASEAMRQTLAAIRVGISENELSGIAAHAAYAQGSEFAAVPPMVMTGERSTLAHGTAGGDLVKAGDSVYLEMGGSVKRYHGAILRSAYVGTPPQRFVEMFDVCRRALEAGLRRMQPGVPCEDVDHACRQVIVDAGYGPAFRHKAGYSIGIALPPDWSEARTLMLRGGEKRKLEPGMVFHVLPAVIEYREYCIGISETVMVTERGHEVLTTLDREYPVIAS